MSTATKDDYALDKPIAEGTVPLPAIDYKPARAKRYRPRIGLIGCGGVTEAHLGAYKKAGYEVVALADRDRSKAEARRCAFFPGARIADSADAVIGSDDVDLIDLALHPADRASYLLAAVKAGKHVLSQKPFVIDLDFGEDVVRAARARGVKLAVNQNGRWAPHVAWMRQAIAAGVIGEVTSVDMLIAWDHNWVAGTKFDTIPQLVLYDFAIHWFDTLRCYTRGMAARRAFASLGHSLGQRAKPPLLAQVAIDFDAAQCSMQFRADARAGYTNRTLIAGTKGTLVSDGPTLNVQTVTLHTPAGHVTPLLEGNWFPDGFDGTMSELVCAIEEDREPSNGGADNLASLAMAFAAIASSERGVPVEVGSVRRLEDRWLTGA